MTANDLATIFSQLPDFSERFCRCVRHAVNWVIDNEYTGRTHISELGKAEKTMIGTKLEMVLVKEFAFERHDVLDCQIRGVPFDIKFSCQQSIMIPIECYSMEGFCLCTELADNVISVGVLKAELSNLTKGHNRDLKKSISKEGRKTIAWLIKENFEELPLLGPNSYAMYKQSRQPVPLAATLYWSRAS